jgi:hypothetical protein
VLWESSESAGLGDVRRDKHESEAIQKRALLCAVGLYGGYGPSRNVLTQKRRRPGQNELKVVSLSHPDFVARENQIRD